MKRPDERLGQERDKAIFLREDGTVVTLGEVIDSGELVSVHEALQNWPKERWVELLRHRLCRRETDGSYTAFDPAATVIFAGIGSYGHAQLCEKIADPDSRVGQQFLDTYEVGLLHLLAHLNEVERC